MEDMGSWVADGSHGFMGSQWKSWAHGYPMEVMGSRVGDGSHGFMGS